MAIELPSDLVVAQRNTDALQARVHELQQQYGRPDAEGSWSDEQHRAWDEAWRSWREAAEALHGQVSALAEKLGQNRFDVEAALKKAARHPDTE